MGCLLFEDEHLLVVNKPAGINTHSPAPHAGEGIYDWLRHREPRWADLAVLHRLDKETSGVLVFGKTALANRSLTAQFTQRAVRKKYLVLTRGSPQRRNFLAKSKIRRAGERYVCSSSGEPAETRFKVITAPEIESGLPHASNPFPSRCSLIEAEPLTGRTHQIRVHAAEHGIPVLGDTLYGGAPFGRVCLHAAELEFRHPASGQDLTFRAPVDFAADVRLTLRAALIDPNETNAFRVIHGASDGWPGWYVDRLGEFLLSQSERALRQEERTELARLLALFPAHGAHHKILNRQVRRAAPSEASPQLVLGEPAPEKFSILENGLHFELSFNEGYSTGLFLDQRDNRRRILTGGVAAGFMLAPANDRAGNIPSSNPAVHGGRGRGQWEILNAFAYTCGFSVCAARTGATTTSLDLSRKYLEWGRHNFALNGLNPAAHEFIYGDVFDWLRRLANKGRSFDVIVLDPPTFSQSKSHGVFRVEKDCSRLVRAALPMLKADGVLFVSTNAAVWPPDVFLECVEHAVCAAKREVLQRHYFPQPPDFPISRSEPAYLKTIWLRVK